MLALNNMIFSDKSYTVSTLQILGKGLGVTDYAVDRLQTDFPKFVEFVEFMKINISELDEFIKPLTPFGICVSVNCNVKIN